MAESTKTRLPAPGCDDVLYVVDLSGYVFRAYHALTPLTSPTGEPTHAVYGTVNMLERLIRDCDPKLLAIAMDAGGSSHRRALYAEYKATRPEQPEDLRSQMARIGQIVEAFEVTLWRREGVEADDLIAAGVKRARQAGLRVVIVSADKDLRQLVGPDVCMWDSMRDRVVGPPEVEQIHGVTPAQLRDLLALMGDTSDNVPGVPSVGPKTARDLLVAHGSLEGIYGNLDSIKRKKLAETLVSYRDQAFLSRDLVTLLDEEEVPFDLERLRWQGRDVERLRAFYGELGFTRLLQLLDESGAGGTASATASTRAGASAGSTIDGSRLTEAKIHVVSTDAELERLRERLEAGSAVAVEPVAVSPSPAEWTIAGIAFAIADAGEGVDAAPVEGWYVPVAHRTLDGVRQLPREQVVAALGPPLANPLVEKVGHNVKRVRVLLEHLGFELDGVTFDVQLASYLLDAESRHSLEDVCTREVGVSLDPYVAVTKPGRGKQVTFDQVGIDVASRWAGLRAAAVALLAAPLREKLRESALDRLHDELELPLASLLAELEARGVLVDRERLSHLGAELDARLREVEARAHDLAGKEFNVHSPRQLETLLFDELKLKPIKRTKTSRSTDAATLEALSEQHPLPDVVLEARQLSKLKGTYVDALPELVSATTGRVHTSWEQAVTATGRLSSTAPNLQNIPIRRDLGRLVRGAFVAPPGHQLVSADYSQIELRVLAHLSEDTVLLEAFNSGQDIHQRTAMEIFEVTADEVTAEHRRRAKAVNFGVIYGQGDVGLAKGLGIKRTEAAAFIAAYFRRYEGVRRFLDDTLVTARQAEVVTTLLGRRRSLPDIRSANRGRRLAAERIAMNTPIQGSAADVLKLAMLALARPVTPGTRMVLTVHDELVFEVPDAEVDAAMPAIRQRMETVMDLKVPLIVDVASGRSWSEAH